MYAFRLLYFIKEDILKFSLPYTPKRQNSGPCFLVIPNLHPNCSSVATQTMYVANK